MRPAPGPIPANMPNIGEACKNIQRMVNRPDIRLCDLSIDMLWKLYSDGTPTWITGSNVWMPAVFGPSLATPSDYDIIFSSSEACDKFAMAAINELNRRVPQSAGQYTLGKTALGSHRILHPDGSGIIDAWALGEHESIGESLMTYPHAYQRAAYLLSHSPSTGCLHRIARDGVADRKVKESLFGKIMKFRNADGYPGTGNHRIKNAFKDDVGKYPNGNSCNSLAAELAKVHGAKLVSNSHRESVARLKKLI